MNYYIGPKGYGRVDNGKLRLISFRNHYYQGHRKEVYKIGKEDLDMQEWKDIADLPLQLLQVRNCVSLCALFIQFHWDFHLLYTL